MTTAEYRYIQRQADKLRNPRKYILTDTLALRQQVIMQHKCNDFTILCKVPHATYGKLVFVSKELLCRYANDLLIPSYINAGGQKRNETCKPCYRFNIPTIRKMCNMTQIVDFGGMTWASWTKWCSTHALRGNAGCEAERRICELMHWEQIGEIDNQSHINHCDALRRETGTQVEIKLETGYMTNQFWTALYEWYDNPPKINR